MLTIAEEDQKHRTQNFRNQVFGLLDISACAYLFLPLFGQLQGEAIQAVSLLALSEVPSYLKIAYMVAVIGIILWGIAALIIPKRSIPLSLMLSVMGTLLFIISSQPYAAAFGFLLLGIKAFLLIKRQ